MRRHVLTFSAMVAIGVAIALAAQPGAAYADSMEGAPPTGPSENLVFSIGVFAFAAVAVALGIYFLWLVARRTRDEMPADAARGKEP